MNNIPHTGIPGKGDPSLQELVSSAIAGDQSAYTLLMQKHKEGLTLYVQEFIGTLKNSDGIIELAEEPQDIVQEAFHKAFQALPTYNPQYKFTTWLYNIARNIAIDYTRKRKISIGANLTPDNLKDIANIGSGIKNSPEDKLISSQEYRTLIEMIDSLDEKYRKPAILRFLREYEYNEIAQELNLELNTVKTRLKRAKELLKKMGNI
ncbi:MAG: sigma-70 family RNA polymerase sigma factor [Bacteroidales bacterium]|jgi:RNA polymerase sigma-70 factor (ECF subfamily)|nr:sigma-70 family RNA polymerase sigma factor [Bacteroidales bacterium]